MATVGDPIVLGVARTPTQALQTAAAGSKISTNEFGVQSGVIRHFCGNQAQAQGLRPAEGTAFSGQLPQFKGFLADYAGDVVGEEGQACYIDVVYCAIDPRFVVKADEDTELRWINTSDSALVSDIATYGRIGLPEPVATIKYADTKRCELTKSTNLYSATDSFRAKLLPPISDFRFVVKRYSLLVGWDPAHPTAGVPTKNVVKYGDQYYRVFYYFIVFKP
ncbi:MAG TPA: hypothetical protein VJS88_00380, partial [Chthoniobacterales bacterium]|nr:hypothetical protein [Chthoniobacterales bacterium]